MIVQYLSAHLCPYSSMDRASASEAENSGSNPLRDKDGRGGGSSILPEDILIYFR